MNEIKGFHDQLAIDEISWQIKKRISFLEKAILEKKQRIKKVPAGRLYSSKSRGNYQFYYVPAGQTKKRCYIKKDSSGLIKSLAQRDYDIRLLDVLEEELILLKKFTDSFHPENIGLVANAFCKGRQKYFMPLFLNDSDFIEQWNSWPYVPKQINSDSPEFYTAKDERVRSKSEVLIADALARFNIPYKYEYPLELKVFDSGKKTAIFYPDFCCLNVRTRQVFYWEHFGMMDDSGYAANAVSKLQNFILNGFFPGKNLIVSMETSEKPLNNRVIESLIKAFLQ